MSKYNSSSEWVGKQPWGSSWMRGIAAYLADLYESFFNSSSSFLVLKV